MELYKILGIEKSADSKEVKKAYFDLAKKHHPDKGGDVEEFKKIQRAYDILSDGEKRSFYDQTGQIPGEGGDDGMHGGGGGMPFDIGSMFGQMFGMGMGPGGPFGMGMGGPFGPGGPRPQRGPPSASRRGKAPPKVHEINLMLSDFYKGRSIHINFERSKFCAPCKGDGFTSFTACEECRGQGVIMRQQMIGPGMAVMNTMPCGACQGAGQKKGSKCWSCQGKCFTNEQKSLEVVIEKGMGPGERLVFPGECSDTQEFAEAGDVHILLGEADEDIPWTRTKNDLRATLNVSFTESVCGCKKMIEKHPGYPDGYEVVVPPGSQHMDQLVFKGTGMPIRGQNDQKGDVIITLHVKITDQEKKACEKNTELLRSILIS